MSTENQPAETPVPDLPAEAPFQSEKVRRTIIASTWIVILLVLPIWWATASLQRLPLPRSVVQETNQVIISAVQRVECVSETISYDFP